MKWFGILIIFGLLLLAGCMAALSSLDLAWLAACIVLGVACLMFPTVGLYVAAALVPIMSFAVSHNSSTTIVRNTYPISYVPIMLAFAGQVARNIGLGISRREPMSNNGVYTVVFALISCAAVSLMWTLDIYHGVCQTLSLVMALCLLFVLMDGLRDEKAIMRLFKFLVPIGVILATMTLVSKNYSWQLSLPIVNRWSLQFTLYHLAETTMSGKVLFRPAGFATPQAACNTLGFFILVMASLYPMVHWGWRRMALLAAMLYMVMNMLLTASKGGLLGFIAGACYLFCTHPDMKRKRLFWCTGLVGAVIGMLILNMLVFGAMRLAGGSGSGQVAEASLSSRLGFWETGFHMMQDAWVGAGAGGLLAVLDPIPGAHSLYFSFLFDLGVVGLMLFGVYVVEMFLRLKRARREGTTWQMRWVSSCMTAAVIMLLIHCLVDIDYSFLYFWLVTGLAYAVSRAAVFGTAGASLVNAECGLLNAK